MLVVCEYDNFIIYEKKGKLYVVDEDCNEVKQVFLVNYIPSYDIDDDEADIELIESYKGIYDYSGEDSNGNYCFWVVKGNEPYADLVERAKEADILEGYEIEKLWDVYCYDEIENSDGTVSIVMDFDGGATEFYSVECLNKGNSYEFYSAVFQKVKQKKTISYSYEPDRAAEN